MLSPPKPLDEIQPNLVCELLTWMGRATSNFFLTPSPGALESPFNFNYKVNFKDFYTKLCVCSHKWKIHNISDGIFILTPGSCPRGETLGRLGCPGGQKKFFFQTWPCGRSNRQGWRAEHFHSRVKLVTLGWGQRSNIIKLRLTCQFQRFLYQILCVFSQIKDTKHIRWDFYSVAWVMPEGWDFWALGVPRGSNNFFFSNMVM